jgi:hypothetical protein
VGENASQIEREIMAERNELGRNLEVLETRARNLADWRVQYRRHPGIFLGAAAGLGVILGLVSHGRSNGSLGYVSYATPERPLRPKRSLTDRLHGPKGRQLMETIDNAMSALLAVGATKAVDYLSNYLPGFSEEYRRSSEERGRGSRSGSMPGGFASDAARDRWDSGQDDR